MYLIYDTETTGFPKNFNAALSDLDNWPRVVQLAWQLHDVKGNLIENFNFIIKPDGYEIPYTVTKIHGISTKLALEKGIPIIEVINLFKKSVEKARFIIGHNIDFDQKVLGSELYRYNIEPSLLEKSIIDTMKSSIDYCALPGGRGGGFKFPKLGELYEKLFKEQFSFAHNAAADVNATARSFFELVRLNVIQENLHKISNDELKEIKDNFNNNVPIFSIDFDEPIVAEADVVENINTQHIGEALTELPYFHFHNHTSFSILSATTRINDLVQKAIDFKMPAVGITDSGNLMGSYYFLTAVKQANEKLETPLLPIVGCEIYISEEYLKKKFTKESPDIRFSQLLLAKNLKGFKNLSKLTSIGNVDGYYFGCARVNKEQIIKYKENLIATTGNLLSEIPYLILNNGEAKAEEAFLWWKKTFEDDFYVELIRHGLEEEEFVNQVLIKLAKKHAVKIIAQNNTFYINKIDSDAHDILLCVRDGEKKETPIGKGRDKRFGFPNNEFYFKSQSEMKKVFYDLPEAIDNLSDLLLKIEPYDLNTSVKLPKFEIPIEFINNSNATEDGNSGENAYLKHLAHEGLLRRYASLTPELADRLSFELETIKNTGYPGYFLIVQDFIAQAKKMGVLVGPGRGSAAGSLVAYCIGITNVDPIKYDLLFERFLNPDRVSLPDIDIDFDDRGRDKIIEWVVNKYGKDQVAQIITYGTMAGKSAIRDTGRVLNLPLSDTDRLAKKVHIKLNKIIKLEEKELKELLNADQLKDSMDIRHIAKQNNLEAEIIKQAQILEGSIRNTGTHACGVIIAPTNISDLVPVSSAKDSDLLVTQFDNAVVENVGLLKMDFLGLRTLTIINDAVLLVEKNYGIKLNVDDFPLDDPKTYQIFQAGNTIGIFQYESPGMQKHLKALKPDKFEDLIAMNALYRPGPLQYIPQFISRKNGKEPITYDLPEMEEYLADTYGITVYQEQVMLLSQKLAGFSKGEADVLRKAMGKKQKAVLDKMKMHFIEGALKNNFPEDKLNKIWTDWEAFAQYAFNKSHSTCYAVIAFQTAYLKANYPEEFMASVLSNNMINIKSVTFFMDECKKMGIKVLCPDVNESSFDFSVNTSRAVRFGIGALKGIGKAAVDSIIMERETNGKFINIFDFVKRVDLRTVNKKTIESLVLSGAFDFDIQIHRAQYFYSEGNQNTIEKLIKFGSSYQDSKNQSQASLFDGSSEFIEVLNPIIPKCNEWLPLAQLNKEKEVAGIYLSAHPLDSYKKEISIFQQIDLKYLNENVEDLIGNTFNIGGLITQVDFRIAKNGKEYLSFTIEDYKDQLQIIIFDEDYLKFKHFFSVNQFLFIRINITQNKYTQKIFYKLLKVDLLQNILEDYSKKIELKIDLDLFNANLLEKINIIKSIYKGEKQLSFNVQHENFEKEIDFPSKSYKININKNLINYLDSIGVNYTII